MYKLYIKMTQIIRALKHLIRGERKVIDESIDYETFGRLVERAGDNIKYSVRCGKGYTWLTEKTTSPPHSEFLLDFFRKINHELYDAEFFGNYQMFQSGETETHYIDCYQWLRRGNVGPKGCKSHEGTLHFTLKRGDLEGIIGGK